MSSKAACVTQSGMGVLRVRELAFAVGLAAGLLAGSAGLARSAAAQNLPVQVADATPAGLAARSAMAALERDCPGVGAERYLGRVSCVYGVPMAAADSPEQAAAKWLDVYGAALGAGPMGKGPGRLELSLRRADDVAGGKFRVFVYDQLIDGVPVELSAVRVLVRRGAVEGLAPTGVSQDAVVLVTAKIAVPDAEAGLAAVKVTAEDAVAIAKGTPLLRSLTVWSQPERVVYFGEGDNAEWMTPRPAWAMNAEVPEMENRRSVRVFVDAATGKLLHVRSNILHVDASGTGKGFGSPGVRSDIAANPAATLVIPGMRIIASNGDETFTAANGAYSFTGLPEGATLTASLSDGLWVGVQDLQTGTAILSSTVNAGTGVIITLNTTPTEFTTAQVNAFIHQTLAHNFFKDRAPDFSGLNVPLPAKVNFITAGGITYCNAFYDGTATNFFQAGNGCNNTAFSTVISHEYGHHIVNQLGLAQGAFGEGFSDCVSILLYDTTIIGQDFTTSGGAIRNPSTANQQYPCTSSAIHTCGQILGGVVRKVRTNFNAVYTSSLALDTTRQLFVDWAQITAGGQGLNSAHPTTAIEMLTADDDDAVLANGTPHYCQIAAAFASHGISSPSLGLKLAFSFPDGLPEALAPDSTTPVRVVVSPNGATPLSNSGFLYYRTNSGASFTSVAMAQTATNEYMAMLPAAACGSVTEFYFQVNSTSGFVPFPNVGCAASSTTIQAGYSNEAFGDDFEQDRGWTVGETTASTGAWVRVDPLGTSAQPEDDNTGAGTLCWATGQGTNRNNPGEADIDNGLTTLVSPTFDLSDFEDATVSYYRWYSNSAGSSPNSDTFRVEVSTNNGATWTNAETVGPTTQNGGDWLYAEWTLSSRSLSPTAQVKVRFIAEDAGSGSLVEAAIDDFAITGLTCELPQACLADYDLDGGVTGADISAFFLDFEQGASGADLDLDGGVTAGDIAVFFEHYEAGC